MIFTFSVVYIRLLRTNNMHRRLKKALLNFPREFPKMTLPLTFRPKLSEFSDEDYLCYETSVHILGSTDVWLENSDSKMAGNEGFCDHSPTLCNCFAYVAHAHSKNLSARKKFLFDMWHL